MTQTWQEAARVALDGTETDTMSFPEGLRLLMDAGFDGYAVDFRKASRTYYRPEGTALTLETTPVATPVAADFDAAAVQVAIREAQAMVSGYTYRGFCAKVAGAGCAGYLVSLSGRRVLYYGRSGETHTEHFPAP